MLLLVPLVYLVVSLGLIQGQSLGAEAGARHIARALSTAEIRMRRAGAPIVILRSVVDEYGIDPSAVDVALDCRARRNARVRRPGRRSS